MMRFGKSAAACCAALVSASVLAADVADTIYSGGPILTIDDEAPRARRRR